MTLGVALLDFGGPQGQEELVPFLTELLKDVLPLPGPIKAVAAPRIARARAKIVGPNYEEIGWSPLVPTHERQVAALARRLGDVRGPMASGMLFTPPTMDECVASLQEQGVDRIIALPMFPHYSLATTGAAFSFFFDALVRAGLAHLPVHWIPAYPEHPSYIAALAATIREGVAATPGPEDQPVHLVFTPHGLPVSFLRRGDPYPDHIRASVRAVIAHLGWEGPYHVGWQSRVGPVRWLTPSTPEVMDAIAAEGGQRICLVPVSFAAEHLETLHELDIEYRAHAEAAGIRHFGRAPALGTQPGFIEALAERIEDARAHFSRYACVRCLIPKPEAHRRRPSCPNCRFSFPAWAREGVRGEP
ncbi:MAG TPA: ferrochelatase [Deltaproteobacteria bacterium]|nr:ferrochelatase [Deltaproteobacteria bacterium]